MEVTVISNVTYGSVLIKNNGLVLPWRTKQSKIICHVTLIAHMSQARWSQVVYVLCMSNTPQAKKPFKDEFGKPNMIVLTHFLVCLVSFIIFCKLFEPQRSSS